jgi:serine/threonine-protein kinase
MAIPTDILPRRYIDVEPLATGGMGEVYRAVDEELGRPVAVKVLAERYARDDSLRERFKREALAAARLSGTPNIVTIFDVGEHESRPYIVMELLAGGSLEARARGRAVEPAEALAWLEEAAAALDTAHAAGIVHRDVKPGNLLFDDHGRLNVADFGIASAAGMDSFTKTGTVLGTAGYLSPEQAQGERATAASDRYALAVVAFELLTGRRPFAADTTTAEAVAHIQAPIPSAHELNAALPREVDAVFERGLAKDPAARYGTAAELVADLRHALHTAAGATAVVRSDAWPTTPTRMAPRPAERRPAWLIPLLVLVALALGGTALAIMLATSGSDKRGATPPPRTVVRTVTEQGTTVERTVTSEPPPPPTTAATTTSSSQSPQSGSALNDAGFQKMQAGDYAGALPLLEQAVQKLAGTGQTAEAYAQYNLAYTRYALGRCDGVLDLLDSSQAIQGHRKEIDDLRKRAKKTCG